MERERERERWERERGERGGWRGRERVREREIEIEREKGEERERTRKGMATDCLYLNGTCRTLELCDHRNRPTTRPRVDCYAINHTSCNSQRINIW